MRIIVLAITGLLASISGVMLSARLLSGNPTVAAGWELDVQEDLQLIARGGIVLLAVLWMRWQQRMG